MAPTYKVAVIQLYPKPMQPDKNFVKAANFIRSAAAQGCHLAVLPEYHLTNWLPKDPKFRSLCANWEQYLKAYQALAKECNICIVPGTIVQTPSPSSSEHDETSLSLHTSSFTPEDSSDAKATTSSEKPHGELPSTGKNSDLENVAYFISNTGAILGKYVKKNLWGPTERAHLTSSGRDAHPAFDTPLGKVGMLICWDLAFPEAFRELICQDVKIVIMPSFWTLSDCSDAGLKYNPSAEAVFLDSTITARAFENTCAVIFANAGGPPGRGYAGLSQIAVPFIGPLTRLGGCAEGMAVVDLDMDILEHAEDNYRIRADLASPEWHYDYRHGKSRPQKL